MAQTLEDHNLVDEAVKAGPLPFVLVRSAMLKNGDAAPLKFYGNTGKGSGIMPGTTMKSVANLLLDLTTSDEYDGTTPMVTN